MTTTIIKGRGKGGSNQTRTPVEAPDSIQSIARAKVLIALGEGEFAGGLDGKNIFLGDSSSYTPLQNADGSYNFNNVKYEFRSGTQDQDYIQGFPGIENELQVSYELKQAVPYVRAVSNTQLSALRIRLGWPTLLLQKNNGDKVGTRVEYAIDLSVDGGPYETVVNGAVDDKTTQLRGQDLEAGLLPQAGQRRGQGVRCGRRGLGAGGVSQRAQREAHGRGSQKLTTIRVHDRSPITVVSGNGPRAGAAYATRPVAGVNHRRAFCTRTRRQPGGRPRHFA